MIFVKFTIRREELRGENFCSEFPAIDKIMVTVSDDQKVPNVKRTTVYKILKELDNT
jgi:uncharacterized protein (UPF0147 family)